VVPTGFSTIRGRSPEFLRDLLSLSFQIKKNPAEFASVLKGKTILQMFIENSTRTRLSFETATRRLGGTNLTFTAASSSVQKGETLLDTVQVIQQYGVDGIVIRHKSTGAPEWIETATRLPVINAGDGAHEHPTQALLDSFTLAEKWGVDPRAPKPFSGKSVMILGDTLHSRVARSNIHLLSMLGARVVVCGPSTLTFPNSGLFPEIEIHSFPETAIREMDAVMLLRIQFERQSQGAIPSLNEYRHFWGLTRARAGLLKKEAVLLHPGPMNRGIEIDPEVADSPRSLILNQVENGVYARMAVLARTVGGYRS
jgi:aspartate carbamoyltransferase catalytic subunit